MNMLSFRPVVKIHSLVQS